MLYVESEKLRGADFLCLRDGFIYTGCFLKSRFCLAKLPFFV